MRLMGLPYDNWQLYANLFHSVMDASDGDEYNKVIAEVPAMIDGLLKFAAARRADPGDDLTSFLVQFEFDGKRLGDNQLIDILWNLIGGGVDTTTSLTALSLLHLGTRPDLRQQLIDRPEPYRTAADEFLRYCSVNKTLSRTVSRDTVLGGHSFGATTRCSSAGWRPTTTSASSTGPTKWYWTGRPTVTSRSGSGLTDASAPRWHGSCST
jgi:cytochrome P450